MNPPLGFIQFNGRTHFHHSYNAKEILTDVSGGKHFVIIIELWYYNHCFYYTLLFFALVTLHLCQLIIRANNLLTSLFYC